MVAADLTGLLHHTIDLKKIISIFKRPQTDGMNLKDRLEKRENHILLNALKSF
jgi:hypothetical protein